MALPNLQAKLKSKGAGLFKQDKERGDKMQDLISIENLSPDTLKEKAKDIFNLLDISDNTSKDYAYRISLFLNFITEKGFNKNSFLQFKRNLTDRGDITISTKNKYLASARVFLKELARNGIIPVDITLNIKGFSQSKKHKQEGLNEEEIIRLRDKIKILPDTPGNIRIKTLFCLFALQGLRQVEIIRLNYEDLNLTSRIAYIQGKGQDDKELIYLNPQTVRVLKEYIKICKIGSGALFRSLGNRKSKRLSLRTPKRDFAGLFEELNIPKTVHGFRHYYITRLLENFEVSTVRKFSRHKSLDMLIVYDDELDLSTKKDKVFDCFSNLNVV